MRSGLGFTCVVLAALSIVGCAGDGSGGLPDAQLMIRNAAAATKDVRSAHILLTVDGDGLAVESVDADVTRKPPAAHGIAVRKPGGQRVEFGESNGTLFVAGPSGKYVPAPPQIAATVPSPSRMLDPERGLGHTLGQIRDATTLGKEAVGGVEAFKIVGTVPEDVLAGLIPTATSDATFTVWLRVRAPHAPLQTNLQFTGQDGQTATLTVKVTDVNEPITITPPA
jgi:lipoprotein LprG